MTTHDRYRDIDLRDTAGRGGQREELRDESGRDTRTTEDAAGALHRNEQPQQTGQTEKTGQTLFADDELAGLRARWVAVQAGFVDDPKDCVQKADGLVTDLLDQLTAQFGRAREGLEQQWSRGEQASTENLRVALQQYRSFFERLLSV